MKRTVGSDVSLQGWEPANFSQAGKGRAHQKTHSLGQKAPEAP